MNGKTIRMTVLLAALGAFAPAWAQDMKPEAELATFAGGCFWCVEADFEKVAGVLEAVSGYAGGETMNPSYDQVSAGGTGHLEVAQIHYDPAKITYEQLLDVFWRHVDPTDPGGQFVDRGDQYRTAIFTHDAAQRARAEASKQALAASGRFDRPVVTEILPLTAFYPAEEYHQDYYKRNPIRYKYYRWNSGRDQFLEQAWGHAKVEETMDATPGGNTGKAMNAATGDTVDHMMEKPMGKKTESGTEPMEGQPMYTKPADAVLREKLTPLQYQVTQEEGTEAPYDNEYWNHKQAGIYVDIVSGEPLFSSLDKYDSRTGWPSFTRPLVPENIVEREDHMFFVRRVEVRSRHGDSHLGHVFPDGPAPTGLRYCINSASLRFVAAAELESAGYGQYQPLFASQ